MFNLDGLKGIVCGVANQRSIGWSTAELLANQGATVGISYLDERAEKRVRPLIEQINAPIAVPCDVRDPIQIGALRDGCEDVFGLPDHHTHTRESTVDENEKTNDLSNRSPHGLDFIVHSMAYAEIQDLKNPLSACSKNGYLTALEVSAYSLLTIVNHLGHLLRPNASIVTLSYLGAERAVEAYGVMGAAKAALEAQVRGLALELGARNIRVNAVSAGPVKTLAAAGIPGFKQLLKESAERTPLGRGVTQMEIAQAIAFLCSSWSTAITGEVLHVDCGAHAVQR